jgi:hypothetical protein
MAGRVAMHAKREIERRERERENGEVRERVGVGRGS